MALFDVGLVNGKDGKSAYQCAKDGGYEGTEEEFNSTLGDLGLTFSSTLATGETSLVFEDARFTTESILDSVYTSIFGVAIKSAIFAEGSLTLTFKEQTEDMTVKVIVK